jgi:hypothetical protein
LFGLAAGGTYLARGALAIARSGGALPAADTARIALARYFAENHAVLASGLKASVVAGTASTLALEPEVLAG